MRARYLEGLVRAELDTKMVFVGGPRDVGKTTMARRILGRGAKGYLHWDVPEHRELILSQELPPAATWVFDEIHKYRPWRNYLKGMYDAASGARRILVTGSGRLDSYRVGGDSLKGRYRYLRLHPFSVAELGGGSQRDFLDLLNLGGFPEPFLRGSVAAARAWSLTNRTRVIREDAAELEGTLDLDDLERLATRLPQLVGSPLSLRAVRDELQVDQDAIASWMDVLERLCVVFRVPPIGAPRLRAAKKGHKHYQFDWSVVPDEAARFENLVASHLLKWVDHEQDTRGRDVELCYFRDVSGRAVDFVLVEKGVPFEAIACSLTERPVNPALAYLRQRFRGLETFQIAAFGENEHEAPDGARMCSAVTYLSRLV